MITNSIFSKYLPKVGITQSVGTYSFKVGEALVVKFVLVVDEPVGFGGVFIPQNAPPLFKSESAVNSLFDDCSGTVGDILPGLRLFVSSFCPRVFSTSSQYIVPSVSSDDNRH